MKIIPAILATAEEDYKNHLEKLEESGLFEWVQIDLMDKKFVQNESIKVSVIDKYPTELKLEAHLMVEYPENWIEELVKVGVDRIIFPVEDSEGILERIQHIKNHEKTVGLSVNPGTAVDLLEPYLDQIDLILIMSVHPGFQGQEFLGESIEKIEKIRQRLVQRDLRVKIEVDGGISEDNIASVFEAGADVVAIGSSLLKYDNLKDALDKLQSAAHG